MKHWLMPTKAADITLSRNYRRKHKKPNFQHAQEVLGISESSDGSIMDPELRKHAAWTVSSKVLSVKRLKDSKWNWDDFKNMNKS